MTVLVIDLLVWDDWNCEHIQKHGCTKADVDFVCSRPVLLWRESYKNRKVVLGENEGGRVLAVILGPVPGVPEGTYYPFSARPCERKEEKFYERASSQERSANR